MSTTSAIQNAARLGRKLTGECIIDGHGHMGPWSKFHIVDSGIEGMLADMDRVGIDVICPSAHACIGPDFRQGNDIVAKAQKKHPRRVCGYVGINPNYPDGTVKEIDRCARFGMRHVKIHSIHGVPYDARAYRDAYETVNARGIVLLAHTWGGDAAIFDELAPDYRGINFLLAHSGVGDFDTYVRLAAKHDNIYLDLATSMAGYGWVERFVREVGAEKVLYGSDIPFISAPQQIGKVLFARITDADKRLILGLNAKRLFGL